MLLTLASVPPAWSSALSRAARLLELLQAFRRYKRPVSGATLAEELGVSLRTIYRDIEALKAQGAAIDGEAGVGFVLKPGFMLPPLMFSEDEIEAVDLLEEIGCEESLDFMMQSGMVYWLNNHLVYHGRDAWRHVPEGG